MDECVREMTFEEEYEILKREANKLFESEIDGCEEPKANCIVRRALRCIDKITKENKMAKEYRELEEQGRLLKLPCKIGDTLWWICDEDENGDPNKTVMRYARPIKMIAVNEKKEFFVCQEDTDCDFLDKIGAEYALLTKEEAEAKLKEMENKTNEV